MLFEAYLKLLREFPDSCTQLFGEPLTNDNSLWISVDGESYPSLLFAASQHDQRNDIQLRSVSVRFSRDCKVEAADGTKVTGNYTVVTLNENDIDVARVFLRLLEEAFRGLNGTYSNKEIASRILELAELFRQIENSVSDIIGLWGELYILSCANLLDRAVESWCSHKKAKYDFVTVDYALEIKTTLKSRRTHRFSLEQLRPEHHFQVYIASLLLVELNSGRTTAELVEELAGNIVDEELKAQFIKLCMLKGGRDLYSNSLRLSPLPSGTSLLMFSASNIPVPQISLDAPIDNVRFDVDLSELHSISLDKIAKILDFK